MKKLERAELHGQSMPRTPASSEDGRQIGTLNRATAKLWPARGSGRERRSVSNRTRLCSAAARRAVLRLLSCPVQPSAER